MRDRVLMELINKRSKRPLEELLSTPGDPEYEKYLRLSNQMNTNELQDVFMGRMDKMLAAVARDRDKLGAKQLMESGTGKKP